MADLSLIEREYDHLKNEIVTFDVDQGDLAVSFEITQHSGAKDKVLIWVNPMLTGNMAFITANWRVVNQTAGLQNILGIAIQEGAYEESRNKLNLAVGTHPNIFIQIAIEIFGDFIRRVTYPTTNPTLGGSIKPHASVLSGWQGDGSPNHTYTLWVDSVALFAIVLFGWWGAF